MPMYWSNNTRLLTSFMLLLKSHWVRISDVSSEFLAKRQTQSAKQYVLYDPIKNYIHKDKRPHIRTNI